MRKRIALLTALMLAAGIVLAQPPNSAKRRARSNDSAPRTPPTHADVKYGPLDRQVMDVWLAKSDKPTPVMVSIHGGGFSSGNKAVSPYLLEECLKSGISVAAITYRLSGEAAAPAQFFDSARAIQFIRSKAKEWNLDSSRIAASGGSAGAGISLWLGFHDDLADPKNEDPVLRQSTRLTCMAVFNAQTSYDPRFIRELFPGTDMYKIGALAMLFRMDPDNLDHLPKEKYNLFETCSPLVHLTKDDASAQLVYSSTMETPITDQGVGIHHPRFGKVLKEKMDALGIECQVHTGIQKGGPDHTRLTMDFVKRHFKIWDAGAAAPTLPPDSPWRSLPLITDGKIDAAWAQVGWGSFVVDGRSVRTDCDERGMGLLLYRPERFGDCQIRVVYRCEKPKSNAGVFVRIDDGIVARIGEKSFEVHRDANGKLQPQVIDKLKEASERHLGGWYPVHHGYEVQILDASDPLHRTGAVYSLAKAAPVPEKPQADWRTMIITLDVERIAVDVDGKRLSSFDPRAADNPPRKNWTEPTRDLKRPTHGYIGLQNHDPGDVVWFQEVSVRPLARTK